MFPGQRRAFHSMPRLPGSPRPLGVSGRLALNPAPDKGCGRGCPEPGMGRWFQRQTAREAHSTRASGQASPRGPFHADFRAGSAARAIPRGLRGRLRREAHSTRTSGQASPRGPFHADFGAGFAARPIPRGLRGRLRREGHSTRTSGQAPPRRAFGADARVDVSAASSRAQRTETSTRRLRGSAVSSGVLMSRLPSPCDSTVRACAFSPFCLSRSATI